ncbi:hypothetical protein Smp_089730 [Schistosoma mansoni]|uniref:hypothetical protein n=1 Tax=Schistosoma mansoni TaxID=6183 RepID=UPI00022DC761|nr:hypothetical protein Smp_089730 [Schistosoma mansoni]|eukprot:XP_018650349.1 hypothetical protein Smp_089730 [Schistosoma mansoni]
MSEKYGIIGWIMGRQLMSAVSSDFQKDRPEQSQFICEASDLRSFESQLCCLSKQNSSRIFGKETYGRLCMRNRKHLDGELFFSTFTKVSLPSILTKNS